MFEWNDDQRFYAMHHPFTFESGPGAVRANELVINGVGGSIRYQERKIIQCVEKRHSFGSLFAGLDSIRFPEEILLRDVIDPSEWNFR